MTDIEARALALVNEVAVKFRVPPWDSIDRRSFLEDVLCHAIEALDAFRQEVSDAVAEYFDCQQNGSRSMFEVAEMRLHSFIIQPKTDPLVIEAREICARVCEGWIDIPKDRAAAYRAGAHDDEADFAYAYEALAKRGLEIRDVMA